MTDNEIPGYYTCELKQVTEWLNTSINRGLEILREDMEKSPPYNPTNPNYEEKNAYFIRTAIYGKWTLTEGYGWITDVFFRQMLDHILEYERVTKKHFNKGMVYAILGIAQIAQGKFDSGIAHLLTAEWEDREVDPQGHSILNTQLWGQFEQKILDYLESFNNRPGVSFPISNDSLIALFKSFTSEDRIFLQGTILALLDNFNQDIVCQNSYTTGRLFDHLKDICIFIEAILRKKHVSSGGSPDDDLTILLREAVNSKSRPKSLYVGYPQSKPKLDSGARGLLEFLNRFENILTNAKKPELLWLHSTLLIRNFTGHHFDITQTTTSSNGNTFSALYRDMIENVILALLYLRHIDAF